jgi:hypothetical protein
VEPIGAAGGRLGVDVELCQEAEDFPGVYEPIQLQAAGGRLGVEVDF